MNAPMNIDQKIEFGQYKGISIRDVYCGTVYFPSYVFHFLIKNLVESEFEFTDYEYSLGELESMQFSDIFPNLKVINKDLVEEVIKERLKNKIFKINFFEIKFIENYIIVENFAEENRFDFAKIFTDIVNNFFENPFKDIEIPKPLIIDCAEILDSNGLIPENLKLLFGAPSYIDWALKEVEHFFINPIFIDELTCSDVVYYPGCIIKKINNKVFTIIQNHRLYKYNISNKAIDENLRKYNSFVKYVSVNTSNNYLAHEVESNFVDDGYGGYLDDEYIDDAFGGEADAYWNID